MRLDSAAYTGPSYGVVGVAQIQVVISAQADELQQCVAIILREGRQRAKARSVKLVRKPKLTPQQQCEAIQGCESGKESLAEVGRSYNVSGWTIARVTG